jgi:protocatechuate 3,4-dioxygenase beta subunit
MKRNLFGIVLVLLAVAGILAYDYFFPSMETPPIARKPEVPTAAAPEPDAFVPEPTPAPATPKPMEPLPAPSTMASLAGTVWNEESGEGVADLEVALYAWQPDRPGNQWQLPREKIGSTLTDGAGAYVLGGIAAGRYFLARGHSPDYTVRERYRDRLRVEIEAGDELRGIDFFLKRGLTAKGRVVNLSSLPVENALVTISQSRRQIQHTNEKGEFVAVGLLPGQPIRFEATARGFGRDLITVDAQGQRLRMGQEDMEGVELVLDRGGFIEGTLLTDSGIPIPAVRIRSSLNKRFCTTERDGSFCLMGLEAGAHDLSLPDRNIPYALVTKPATIHLPDRGSRSDVELVAAYNALQFKENQYQNSQKNKKTDTGLAPYKIKGLVVDEQQQPIPFTHVSARQVMGVPSGRRFEITNEEGAFTLRCETTDPLILMVHGEQPFTRQEFKGIVPGGKQRVFVMKHRPSCTGWVLDSVTLEPVQHFSVALSYGRGMDRVLTPATIARNGEAIVHGQGKFTVEPNTLEEVLIQVTADGFGSASRRVLLQEETGDLEFLLPLAFEITGRVLGPDRMPLPGSQILVNGAAGGYTDEMGLFRIENLNEGHYDLRATHSNYLSGEAMVDLGKVRSSHVELQLEEGGVLEGVVLFGGVAKPNQSIDLRYTYPQDMAGIRTQKKWNSRTDAQGYYHFERLQPAHYTVSCRRCGIADTTVVIESGQITVLDFVK